MKCVLMSYQVPNGLYNADGSAHAMTKCETHDWVFHGQPQLMCPIGRIEDAAEKAIEKIRSERP